MMKSIPLFSMCFALLASTLMADDASDFRSALQVTFPATVSVQPSGVDNQRPQNDALQDWQRQAFRGNGFGMGGLDMRGMGMAGPGMQLFSAQNSIRAGFAISADLVLTQLNAADDELTITTADNSQHDAKVIARDNVTGLCVAKIEGAELVSLVVGDGHPELGLPVVTTWVDGGVHRCKQGMISSSLNSSHAKIGMTQDVDFSNPNAVTGSPIVDSAGVLVGVTVQDDNGAVVCLPATQLSRLIDSALADKPQDLERGLVGVAFGSDTGAEVTSVTDGSPAAKAGLLQGDRVTRVDDYDVSSSQDVIAAVAMARAGDSVEVVVQRGDETIVHTLTLGQHPEQRITLSPLPENPAGARDGVQGNGGAIVRQQGWQLKDGKLVPMDLDADGNFDMVIPKEFQDMFQNGPNALPKQFRMPRRFQGLRVERSDTEETLRKLEAERDRQAEKIKELTDKIQELESNQ
ncbi:S1C family serine protease [Stieleria marina]|uniref:Putative periplasmic serine endoprotease DegP-like n=1 Tax=Stieleria marina TaxID=1930275 RepID=A0A517NZH2_9BACT|nr:putative periplasmic serine endoprotease DegP-like precursor [Planctomycetes bacterium K23_9]